MKKLIFILTMALAVVSTGCQESDFEDNYKDPSKIGETTVPKQYAGVLEANKDYVMPAYRSYFVVYRTTMSRWTQSVGWVNDLGQYVVGSASIGDVWNAYYDMLLQYRGLEAVMNDLPEEEKAKNRIYMLTASIYFFDHTQKMVDLFGSIPFSEAGKFYENNGDYLASLPGYDGAEDIYTFMLDELKAIAGELNSVSMDAVTRAQFETQDFINGGDVTLWKKYCNSLRLRMLNRVSAAANFSSRADSEMAEILGNSGAYPVVMNNGDNIQIEVSNITTGINSNGFETGLEDWDGNIAGKKMIDYMVGNSDPRLRAIFETRPAAAGVYQGVDPLANSTDQSAMIRDGYASIYNRSTISRNEYFPGMLMNAAEVDFIKAEYYLRTANTAMAKANYEAGVQQSVEWYYWVRTLTADQISGPLTPLGATEVSTYLTSAGASWDAATDKLALIATQKWIHFNVIQLHENYAEQRRLNLPSLQFQVDNSNAQSMPPVRWLYPDEERSRNTENYQAVSSMDNMTTKMFWDVN